MTNKNTGNPVEIFAGDQWEVSLVRSLLEDAGIVVFLKDELIGTLAPYSAEPGGTSPIKVVVSGKDYERANHIIEEFKRNKKKK